MEGPPTAPYPVNLESHSPALETGGFTVWKSSTTAVSPNCTRAYIPCREYFCTAGDPFQLGRSSRHCFARYNRNIQNPNFSVDIPFFSSTGIYDITNISFAYLCPRKRLRYGSGLHEHQWWSDFYYSPRHHRANATYPRSSGNSPRYRSWNNSQHTESRHTTELHWCRIQRRRSSVRSR